MTTILFSQSLLAVGVGGTALIWYAAPLIVAVSLVYGATRHEYLKEIVANSMRAALYLLIFLGAIFAIVWWASSKV